jgi:hypothetical protein
VGKDGVMMEFIYIYLGVLGRGRKEWIMGEGIGKYLVVWLAWYNGGRNDSLLFLISVDVGLKLILCHFQQQLKKCSISIYRKMIYTNYLKFSKPNNK